MLKKIAIGVAAVILAVLIFAATKPDSFSVERSTTINATPDRIVPLLDNFHNWGSWSPWEKLDPAMQRTFSGPTAGQGAAYAWKGKNGAGAGRMQITQTSLAGVGLDLDFTEPFASHNKVSFRLEPQGSTTKVTWVMAGPSPYMSKVMQVFMSFDTMIGKDFEKGLAGLKVNAEKQAGTTSR